MLKIIEENIDRIKYRDFTPDEFRKKYEDPNIPVIIEGFTKEFDASFYSWEVRAILMYNERICIKDTLILNSRSEKMTKERI